MEYILHITLFSGLIPVEGKGLVLTLHFRFIVTAKYAHFPKITLVYFCPVSSLKVSEFIC